MAKRQVEDADKESNTYLRLNRQKPVENTVEHPPACQLESDSIIVPRKYAIQQLSNLR